MSQCVFCKISSTSSYKIIASAMDTRKYVLMRGLTKYLYKFVWGSSHCSMKSEVELIYRSINSVHNHILPILMLTYGSHSDQAG